MLLTLKLKLFILLLNQIVQCSSSRLIRTGIGTERDGGLVASSSHEKIDLDTIEGVEQVTKLVLLKTDSLPTGSSERIDGRYLNSLIETLYTGLRKPFKSVSADILGIFPSFEEIQVRCDKSLDDDKGVTVDVKRRRSPHDDREVEQNNASEISPTGGDRISRLEGPVNETVIAENDGDSAYESPEQVCSAVTQDCLPMEDLVNILPPSVTTFDKALVRLCPVMLFRIMNRLCRRSSNSIDSQRDADFIPAYGKSNNQQVERDDSKNDRNAIDFNRLQILKNLQNSDELNSKKPQKLHKKLKTQTTYKTNGHLDSSRLRQHGVDEQLLKIRLKLNEPSIEKVWIFSLLFAILSIMVSMGGLIVLPFVKKTTRRRILTLFEGLAVGGLTGSATLHMFPQAFGLVDENYHKYFWRIFVVFFGIYLCYLCERIMKILKVVRTKMRRRSRASLIDMEFCYGFPSINREISREKSRTPKDSSHNISHSTEDQHRAKRKRWGKSEYEEVIKSERKPRELAKERHASGKGKQKAQVKTTEFRKRDLRNLQIDELDYNSNETISENSLSDFEATGNSNSQTRKRLIKCLQSVQKQFSPVYAVQTLDGQSEVGNDKSSRARNQLMGSCVLNPNAMQQARLKKNRSAFRGAIFDRSPALRKQPTSKEQMAIADVETMLYHRNRLEQQTRNEASNLGSGYLQQRLSSVKDVAGERQDQDNAARMSVDTVAWMIVFGDAVLNVIDGLSIGAAFERNILAGISISVAVMLEEVTHRLGTFAVLIRAGMSMQQSLLCTFLSACAIFPGLIIGILLSDATEDATPYIFCAAGGIFLYMALVDVMKEMNRSIENAIRKDIKSTLQIFALQNVGIILAVIFLSFLALYEQAMDFEEYQMQYNHPS